MSRLSNRPFFSVSGVGVLNVKGRPGELLSVIVGLTVVLVWFGVQAHVLANEPDEPSETSQTASSASFDERIQVLLNTLQSGDREEVLRAQQELLKAGWEAVPQIEQRLRSSDGGVLYRLLQQIRSLHAPPLKQLDESSAGMGVDQFSIDKQLSSIKKWLNDTSPPKNEQLLLQRFSDAVERYRNGEPRRGLTIAKALLIVAPEASFASKVRRFIRKCRERIFNESTIRANLKTNKIRYAWDETIPLTFQVKNVSGKPVTLHFDPPEDRRSRQEEEVNDSEPGSKQDSEAGSGDGSPKKKTDEANRGSGEAGGEDKGQSGEVKVSDETSDKTILLEYEHEKIGISGDSTSVTGYREYEIPKNVHLPAGSTWKKTVTFDTSSFSHQFVLRRLTLRARVTPTFVDVGQGRLLRWISFGSADFELFPRGMRKSRPVTVEKIKRHLKAGNLRDVFFMTFLLSSDQSEPLVKFFLRVLPFLKRGNARTIMFLLRELTGKQFYYNREKWLNWGRDTFNVDARPPETNQESPPIPIYDN